jgi:hypothetical protein
MACGSCVDKLARKLMRHHKIDMIRAYELAEKGVERVGNRQQPKQLPLDDPYDYTGGCTSTGTCSCFPLNTECYVSEDCADAGTCGCSCPDPPIAHSHKESNTCSYTLTHNCACTTATHKCKTPVGHTCTCGCAGLCYYHCDTDYVWNGSACVPVVTAKMVVQVM